MKQITTIQRLTGLLLLLVFTLSATPKVFIHGLVADHRDGPTCILDHNTTVAHTQTFNCDFDDLVVSVPFVLSSEPPIEILRDYALVQPSEFYTSYTLLFFQQQENRGPPSV